MAARGCPPGRSEVRIAAIRRRFHERQTAVSIVFEADPYSERSVALREEVDRLPERLRAAVVLCYFERMSNQAAAEKLGVTEAAVRGRLAKARRLLKERLGRDLDGKCSILAGVPPGNPEYKVPPLLIESTTLAGVAFSNGVTDKNRIASSVLKMAEGALKMMFVGRIMRVLIVVLLGAAGTAFVGAQTKDAPVAQEQRNQPASPGRTDPKPDAPQDILIQGESIQAKAENDRVLVDGPGKLSMWVERGFLTGTLEDRRAERSASLRCLRSRGRKECSSRVERTTPKADRRATLIVEVKSRLSSTAQRFIARSQ